MAAKCPEKVWATGSVEGVYQGNDCGDYCYSTLALDDGESFIFMCGEDVSKEFFGQPGNRVSVTYEARQFWSEMARSLDSPAGKPRQ
jgi:hypothetical protein